MDISARARRDVAKQFDVPHWCATGKGNSSAQDIEAVYIATPQNYALQPGGPGGGRPGSTSSAEKPIAVSLAEVDQMGFGVRESRGQVHAGLLHANNVYNVEGRGSWCNPARWARVVMGRERSSPAGIPDPRRMAAGDVSISHGAP